jgi:acyl carrier protein
VSNKSKNISIEDIEKELIVFLRNNIIDGKMQVDAQTPFDSLRIDSLSIVEMLLFLERKYQVSIPETELTPETFTSAGTLAACAYRCLQHG